MKRKIVLIVALFLVTAALIAQKAVRTVYVTKNGTKYHAAHCRTLKKATPTEISEADAIAKNYTPCKLCIDSVASDKPKAAKDAVTQKGGDGAPRKADGVSVEPNAPNKAAAVSSVKP